MTASQRPADNELREAVAAAIYAVDLDAETPSPTYAEAESIVQAEYRKLAVAALAVVAARASLVFRDMVSGGYITDETAEQFLPALAGES